MFSDEAGVADGQWGNSISVSCRISWECSACIARLEIACGHWSCITRRLGAWFGCARRPQVIATPPEKFFEIDTTKHFSAHWKRHLTNATRDAALYELVRSHCEATRILVSRSAPCL
jgi:hypothetical protein